MTLPKYIRWDKLAPDIQRMIDSGMSRKEIAAHYGVREGRLRDAMYRQGIKLSDEARSEIHRRNLERQLAKPGALDRRKLNSKLADKQRAETMRRNYADPEFKERMDRIQREKIPVPPRSYFSALGKMGIAARKAKENNRKAEEEMLAAMTPFERQLWKVRNGRASITRAVDVKPRKTYDTLGGVATYEG